MTPLVGAGLSTPVLGGSALAAFLLVALAGPAVGTVVTVAHESGHMVVGALTGHRISHFQVDGGWNGATSHSQQGWGPGRILLSAAGYTAPPLLGLGGAALLATGRTQPLLWTAVVLLALALPKAEREWTTALVLLTGVAVGYVALYGSPLLRATFAAGLVWLLLFGGARAAVESSTADGTDSAKLAHDTLIPRGLWKAGFVVLALYCLWQGFVLLRP
jgi:hypothetical protein